MNCTHIVNGKFHKTNCVLCYLIKEVILLLIGGLVYMGIEILWRGYTHWTMGIVGGLCFVLIGLINELFNYEMPIEYQAIISAVIVTVVEFISGMIINVRLGWNVWDYSNLPLNICGQVCLLFSVLWLFLSIVAIGLDDIVRCLLFHEEAPDYKSIIFGNFKKK